MEQKVKMNTHTCVCMCLCTDTHTDTQPCLGRTPQSHLFLSEAQDVITKPVILRFPADSSPRSRGDAYFVMRAFYRKGSGKGLGEASSLAQNMKEGEDSVKCILFVPVCLFTGPPRFRAEKAL